jgi:hypothetical protein
MEQYKMAFPSVKKFYGKNYNNWAFNMTILLSQERCIDTLWMTLAGPELAIFDHTALNPEQAFTSSVQPEFDPSRDIFLDCACSRHVMNRKGFFITYLPLKDGVCEVRGFNKSRAYAKGVGNVRLPMRIPGGVRWITLQNVLHMEESANLASQGRLIRRGLHFEVNGYGTNIYSPTSGELLACAPLVGMMQPFDIAWDAVEDGDANREIANMTTPGPSHGT